MTGFSFDFGPKYVNFKAVNKDCISGPPYK